MMYVNEIVFLGSEALMQVNRTVFLGGKGIETLQIQHNMMQTTLLIELKSCLGL